MAEDVKGVLAYLVARALTDKRSLDMLYEYYVKGYSPSEIAQKYEIPKYKVKTLISSPVVKRKYRLVRTLLEKYYNALRNLETIYEKLDDDIFVCKLCGWSIKVDPQGNRGKFRGVLFWHVRSQHKREVNEIVLKLLSQQT